ncbi:site-specific integrase [Microbacterium sp. C5A9]|uniref:tyrosine-type recombinase/integrase n=1 Tax=Microbacterium sp. C5A9 TaxID=2736663 RepID=UPI001F515AAB|nr:site-specific integrase [Microbacterium sp. C5A9]MCI1019381.1 site-specific integrase [Microbacterium sp. C5A9]
MEKAKQLPSGQWRQRFTGPDGKRHSTTDTSARKVQKKAALALSDMIKSYEASKAEEQHPTRFDTFAEDWLQTRRPGSPGGYAVSSYRKRLHHLAELNKTFGHRMIEDITPAEIRQWWNRRSTTPTQRSTLYWFIHAIFEVALDDELIHRNPCRVKDASKKASKKRPTFTDDDMQKIHDAAEGDMKTMILVLMGTALRIGELLALDWADIELLDARLHVTKHSTPYGIQPGTKTGEDHTRTIDLPAWVLEALEGLYAGSEGDGPVFRNAHGGRLSIDSAERRFRVIRSRAGLEEMHLHDLRHVALTAYANQHGVTLKDVMEFGGHVSERVAMGYQHGSRERAQQFARESVPPRWVRS